MPGSMPSPRDPRRDELRFSCVKVAKRASRVECSSELRQHALGMLCPRPRLLFSPPIEQGSLEDGIRSALDRQPNAADALLDRVRRGSRLALSRKQPNPDSRFEDGLQLGRSDQCIDHLLRERQCNAFVFVKLDPDAYAVPLYDSAACIEIVGAKEQHHTARFRVIGRLIAIERL